MKVLSTDSKFIIHFVVSPVKRKLHALLLLPEGDVLIDSAGARRKLPWADRDAPPVDPTQSPQWPKMLESLKARVPVWVMVHLTQASEPPSPPLAEVLATPQPEPSLELRFASLEDRAAEVRAEAMRVDTERRELLDEVWAHVRAGVEGIYDDLSSAKAKAFAAGMVVKLQVLRHDGGVLKTIRVSSGTSKGAE